MDIKQTVKEILAEQAMVAPSDVEMNHSLDDLGIDSMGIVETIFGIEEAFDVSVPFNSNNPSESAFDVSSVSSIVAAVEALVKERA